MGRSIGALLALLAVIGFAVSIASSAWWSGHPIVNGRAMTAKHVAIGPLGATGCNRGGDGSCEPLEIDEPLNSALKAELGAIAVAMLLAFFVLIAAYKVADSRRGIAKTSLVMTLIAAAGGGALLALGPGLKATNVEVPLGWGAYVFGGAISAALVAALLTRKLEPEPLRLKPSATPLPMPVPPGFSPQQFLERAPPTQSLATNPQTIPASAPPPPEPGSSPSPRPAQMAHVSTTGEDASDTIPSPAAPPPEGLTRPDRDRVRPSNQPPRATPPRPPPRPRQPSAARSKPPSELRAKPPSAPPRSDASSPVFRSGYEGLTRGTSDEAVTQPSPPLGEALTRAAPPLHEQKTSLAPPRPVDERFDGDEGLTQRAPPRTRRAAADDEPVSHAAKLANEALSRPARTDEEARTRFARPEEALTRPARPGDSAQQQLVRNDESRPRTKTLPPRTTPPPTPTGGWRATPAPNASPLIAPQGSQPGVARSHETMPPTRLSPSPTSPANRASRPKVPMPAPRPPNPTLPHAIPPPPDQRVTTEAEGVTAVEIDAEAKAAAKQRSGSDARTGQRDAMMAEVTDTGVEVPRAAEHGADAPTEIAPFTGLGPLSDHITAPGDVTDQSPPIDLYKTFEHQPELTPADFRKTLEQRPTRQSPIPIDLPSRPSRSSVSTAPSSLPPPEQVEEDAEGGPKPACPRCESPMSWVEEHLRFYCKECVMYF